MKILEILFNILEFLFAVLGFCLVVVCLTAYMSESGCLKINDYQSKRCVIQKEKQMKHIICVLVACVISVTLTVTFGLNSLAAFLLGMGLGFIAMWVAAAWKGHWQ